MTTSKIQWTEKTWNPIRGCARVSAGCENCYAERHAHRFSGPGQPWHGLTVLGNSGPRWAGEARFIPEKLGDPLKWQKPQRVFVNSMTDLFHGDITNEQIAAVFGVMAACPQHTFQVLTKRPARMVEWFRWFNSETQVSDFTLDEWYISECYAREVLGDIRATATGRSWPLSNVWLGVSVENQTTANERIPLLLQCPAAVRWVRAEPLLDAVDLEPWMPHSPEETGQRRNVPLDWIVVGGESGAKARPCNVEWIRSIVRQCKRNDVPVFVKQLGAFAVADDMAEIGGGIFGVATDGVPAGRWSLRLNSPKGGDPDEWPEDLRVREYPPTIAVEEPTP